MLYLVTIQPSSILPAYKQHLSPSNEVNIIQFEFEVDIIPYTHLLLVGPIQVC